MAELKKKKNNNIEVGIEKGVNISVSKQKKLGIFSVTSNTSLCCSVSIKVQRSHQFKFSFSTARKDQWFVHLTAIVLTGGKKKITWMHMSALSIWNRTLSHFWGLLHLFSSPPY